MRRLVETALLSGVVALLAVAASAAQERGLAAARGTGFDFYVLSLSWSPSYCAAEGERANRQQCGENRDFAFIAHGLWPQFSSGYPEYCASPEPDRVPDRLVQTVIDIMPSAGLVGHQWRKHGSCTGLSQANYLAAVREAYGRITVPDAFGDADDPQRMSADAAEAAFIAANPGMTPDGIAVSCKSGRLAEVRICLTKDLSFRGCAEVDARGCRATDLTLPAAP